MTDKGRTAAELMVFARYVMFSEVYWHHGVRAATAMFQRAFYLLHGALDLDALFRMTEHEFIAELAARGRRRPGGRVARRAVRPHAAALQAAGPVQHSPRQRELYQRLARRPYPWLAACAEQFAACGQHGAWGASWPRTRSSSTPRRVAREVQFDSRSISPRRIAIVRLGEVSPVVRTLATEQFDDYVKRVRIFAHPRLVGDLRAAAEPAGTARPGDPQDGVD